MIEVLLGCVSDNFVIALGFSVFSKLSDILMTLDLESAGVGLLSGLLMMLVKLLLLCLKKTELLMLGQRRECCSSMLASGKVFLMMSDPPVVDSMDFDLICDLSFSIVYPDTLV